MPLPPLPPPLPVRFPLLLRLRSPFHWAVGLSVAVHVLLAIAVGMYKPVQAADIEAEDTIVATIVMSTPPPTPVPTEPSPRPPPPRQALAGKAPAPRLALSPAVAPPRARPLRLNVLHTTGKASGGPTEGRYIPPAGGSANGVPGGTGRSPAGVAGPGTSGNGSGAEGVAEPVAPLATPPPAAPAPSPSPMPTPTCAVRFVEARTVNAVTPEYPLGLDVSGTVEVLVHLTPTGELTSASVYRSSGNRVLDLTGVEAAKSSTYAPAIVNCQPVGGTYIFIASFTYRQ